MKEQKNKQLDSLWGGFLKEALMKTEKKHADILVFGDSSTGKKSLIDGMIKYLHQEDDVMPNFEGFVEQKIDNEQIYILNYKFVKITQFLDEPDSEEVGKINFYIINHKYDFIKNFIKEEIFKNAMFTIVVDLSKPDTITHQLIEWINYINNSIMPITMSFTDATVRPSMMSRFESSLVKHMDIINADRSEEEIINKKIDTDDFECNFGIPLLILGTKSDTLDNIKEEKPIEAMQYNLRSFSLKYGASLMYTSTNLQSNIKTLIEYLSFLMLDKENQNLRVSLNNEDLFVPVGYDQIDVLKERFKDSLDYLPSINPYKRQDKKERKKDESKIADVQTFLLDLKNGKQTYYNPNEQQENRTSIFQNSTVKIMEILQKKVNKNR